jgi:hypothetical protein
MLRGPALPGLHREVHRPPHRVASLSVGPAPALHLRRLLLIEPKRRHDTSASFPGAAGNLMTAGTNTESEHDTMAFGIDVSLNRESTSRVRAHVTIERPNTTEAQDVADGFWAARQAVALLEGQRTSTWDTVVLSAIPGARRIEVTFRNLTSNADANDDDGWD